MTMTERVTTPAIEANMEVTALLMREDAFLDLALADGDIDEHERERIGELRQRRRDAQAAATHAIELADFHIECITGYTRVGGPSKHTVAKAGELGLDVVDEEQTAWQRYANENAASAAD